MSQYIEDFLPPIQSAGLNTLVAVTLGSTLTVTGAFVQTGLLTATAGVTTPASYTALSSSASTSGGVTTPAVKIGVDLAGIYYGSGAPSVSAPKGSWYMRADGTSTITRFYINTNGATSWTAGVTVV